MQWEALPPKPAAVKQIMTERNSICHVHVLPCHLFHTFVTFSFCVRINVCQNLFEKKKTLEQMWNCLNEMHMHSP